MGSTSFSRVVNSRGPIGHTGLFGGGVQIDAQPSFRDQITPSTPSLAVEGSCGARAQLLSNHGAVYDLGHRPHFQVTGMSYGGV